MSERKLSLKWVDDVHGNRDRARISKSHENRVAGALGGKRLPASGAKKASHWADSSVTAGGDIVTRELLIEHKRAEVETASIGVTRKWLQKVTQGANRAMKTPAMVLTFQGADGFSGDWLLLPLDIATRLLQVETESKK